MAIESKKVVSDWAENFHQSVFLGNICLPPACMLIPFSKLEMPYSPNGINQLGEADEQMRLNFQDARNPDPLVADIARGRIKMIMAAADTFASKMVED